MSACWNSGISLTKGMRSLPSEVSCSMCRHGLRATSAATRPTNHREVFRRRARRSRSRDCWVPPTAAASPLDATSCDGPSRLHRQLQPQPRRAQSERSGLAFVVSRSPLLPSAAAEIAGTSTRLVRAGRKILQPIDTGTHEGTRLPRGIGHRGHDPGGAHQPATTCCGARVPVFWIDGRGRNLPPSLLIAHALCAGRGDA
jgi:hypothetical protein